MNNQVYTLLLYSISFLLFYALLWLSKQKKGLRLFDEKGIVANPPVIIVLHIGGIILFGALPYLSNHLSSLVVFNGIAKKSLATWTSLALMILCIIISRRIATKKYREAAPTGFVNTSPGNLFIISYFFLRIVFICAYEAWFRGYLLNDCIINLGVPLAILLNIGLYALLHLANGKEETLACLPFGLLLCCLCIWQGAVWPAIAIHLALTLSYEINFIRKLQNHKLLQYEDFHNRGIGVSR